MSVDYVDIQLKAQLSRVSLDQLAAYCFDSAAYPDNIAQFGTNTCASFDRYTVGTEPSSTTRFALKDGWSSTYLNLAQTNLGAANVVVSYRKDVAELLGRDSDLGRISVNGNLYRILESSFSGTGRQADTEQYQGAIGTPRWQTSTTVSYSLDKFSTSLNVAAVSDTIRFNGATPATIEQNAFLTRKGYEVYNLFFSYDVTESVEARLNVNNVANERLEDQRDGAIYSAAGRTWQISVNARF